MCVLGLVPTTAQTLTSLYRSARLSTSGSSRQHCHFGAMAHNRTLLPQALNIPTATHNFIYTHRPIVCGFLLTVQGPLDGNESSVFAVNRSVNLRQSVGRFAHVVQFPMISGMSPRSKPRPICTLNVSCCSSASHRTVMVLAGMRTRCSTLHAPAP